MYLYNQDPLCFLGIANPAYSPFSPLTLNNVQPNAFP